MLNENNALLHYNISYIILFRKKNIKQNRFYRGIAVKRFFSNIEN